MAFFLFAHGKLMNLYNKLIILNHICFTYLYLRSERVCTLPYIEILSNDYDYKCEY